jgi:hypothetical protein
MVGGERAVRPPPARVAVNLIAHHAAESLIFPLPAPGSQPKRAPIPWDAAAPFKGLGWRSVAADAKKPDFKLAQHPADKV